jgi:hypothetical protein
MNAGTKPRGAQVCRIEGPAAQHALEFKAFNFPLDAALARELPASPGGVQRDEHDCPLLLHYAPGRYLVPAPTPELRGRLAALQDAGTGAVFEIDGKWQVLTLAGSGAWRLLAATINVTEVLAGRDCAALYLFDCPAVLARRGDGFDVWVEASYANALRERMAVSA